MLNIASWFKRKQPLWQQKDDQARASGVGQSKDQALLDQLPSIALNDASATVRLRALARIDDLQLLLKIEANDPDAAVREAVGKRVRDMLSGAQASQQDEAERVALLATISNRQTLEHALKAGTTRAIREAALSKLDRPALYKQCAIGDADPQLRRFALERVRDLGALKAIIEATRKTDKALSKQAALALENLKFNAGDPATVRARALGLCERLEDLVRSVEKDEAPVLRLREEWRALGAIGDDGLQRRFDGALQTLRETIDAPSLRAEQMAEANLARADIAGHLQAAAADEAEDIDLERRIGSLDQLMKLSRDAWKLHVAKATETQTTAFQEALAAAQARLVALVQLRPADPRISAHSEELERALRRRDLSARDLERESARLDSMALELPRTASNEVSLAALHERISATRHALQNKAVVAKALAVEVEGLIDALAAAVTAGDSKVALQIDQRIQNAHNAVRPAKLGLSSEAQKRLLSLETDLIELKKWRGWSNASARERLLEEAAALKGSALHPDALAERARELRELWRTADPRKRDEESEQGKAFTALLEEALKPAKAYFDKRLEIQQKHLAQSRALLTQLTTLPESIDDWRAVTELAKLARDDLRDLDRLPVKVRGRHAKALRDAIDAVSLRVNAHFDDLGAQRERLIAAAEALGSSGDTRSAITQVKQLSERWKDIKGLPRKRDQAYWLRFRAAVDQVFARADEQRNLAKAEQTKLSQQQLDLVQQALAISAGQDARQQLAAIRQSAAQLGDLPRELDVQLDQAFENIELAELKAKHSAVIDSIAALRTKLAARRRLQPMPELSSRREWDAALAQQSPREPEAALALTLLIELELIAGIESPEADRETRMDLNVARLAKRMRGELRGSVQEQTLAQSARYLEIEMSVESAAALDDRLFTALEKTLA